MQITINVCSAIKAIAVRMAAVVSSQLRLLISVRDGISDPVRGTMRGRTCSVLYTERIIRDRYGPIAAAEQFA